MKVQCLVIPSLRSPYLDGFLNIDARFSYGHQQLIEPSHLLDKDRVHALSVGRGVPPHCRLNIKVVWKFAQDVTGNLVYNFIRRLRSST